MKKEIREKVLALRKRVDRKRQFQDSFVIQKKLMECDFYTASSSLLVYCHCGKEVMTDLVINDAILKGKEVTVPFNDMNKNFFVPSRIYSESDINRKLKVPNPFSFDPYPEEKLDLLIMPGVAFDDKGNRIGMGCGFFDRFLSGLKKGITKVALAYDFQVLNRRLPHEKWDKKVDIIITEKRTIKVKS